MNKMAMTFAELCKLADFQASSPSNEWSKKDDEGVPEGRIREEPQDNLGCEEIRLDGLAYRVQSFSPESRGSDDQADRATLVVLFLMGIFVVAILVTIFGPLLYE
jgi:hypothetical protein